MLKTEIVINAPPDIVWRVLTRFRKWDEWNPVINRIRYKRGADTGRISIRLLPWVPSFSVQVAIIDLRDRSQFGWRACLLSERIFQGEHLFALISPAPHSVRFVQTETYSGVLAPVIGPFLKPLSRQAFKRMDDCLKSACEAVDTAESGELVAPANVGQPTGSQQ